MPIALSVNMNKIALLRNSREGDYPTLSEFAVRALKAGAQGLTVHPRPDQRHVRAGDVPLMAKIAREAKVEFNIEGNPFAHAKGTYPGLVELALANHPDQCTLVPDSDQQLTSDHGFDLNRDGERLLPLLNILRAEGIRVSLFMDPVPEQIHLAAELGADRIELYTGPYAEAYKQGGSRRELEYKRHREAAELALKLGLGLNAGHDLNLHNLPLYVQIPGLLEVSIGHALTVDALNYGWEESIRRYAAICAV